MNYELADLCRPTTDPAVFSYSILSRLFDARIPCA